MTNIQQRLFALADTGYKDFQCRLVPTVQPETIIGVRTPELRRLASEINGTTECRDFLATLPHQFYDENNLHGFIISKLKNYDETVSHLEEFLPYIDNWATCDLISPKCFGKNQTKLYPQIETWLRSGKVYTIRFGVEMLITWFLGDFFNPSQLELVAGLDSGEYYIDTVCAWYFATALTKQYETTLPYITEERLNQTVHNKAIQKAIESLRISEDQKTLLRTLRIKNR